MDGANRTCLIVDDITDVTVAATLAVLLAGARERLERPDVREILAPLIAGALERFLADGEP